MSWGVTPSGVASRIAQDDKGLDELRARGYDKVRIRVSNETDNFTVMVCTEKRRQTTQTARVRYAASTVRTMVPIESGCSFLHAMPLRWVRSLQRARRDLLISKAQQIKETDASLGEICNARSRRCF